MNEKNIPLPPSKGDLTQVDSREVTRWDFGGRNTADRRLQRGIRFASDGQDQRDLSAPLGTVRDADLTAVEIGHLLREGQS